MKVETNAQSKTFRGRTMAEALDQVKRHFGRHAVILQTRSVAKGRFLGVRGRECVEITAAAGTETLLKPSRVAPQGNGRDPIGALRESVNSVRSAGLPRAPVPEAMLSEIGALKSMVSELVRETRRARVDGIPEALYDTYTTLIQNEVGERLARDLIERVRGELSARQLDDPQQVCVRLAAAVEAMLPTTGPLGTTNSASPTIVALVGPTGVGKTTTIAKLAANFRLREHKRVALITIDTYRIAAVAQLKTYAEIMDIPLEVVMTPKHLRDAVAQHSDKDLILVDTAGRSPRDAVKVKELGSFFTAVRPHETHLVLSGTVSESVMVESVERFREVGFDRLIFTKLDEAVGFGVILNCLEKVKAGLSYVTTGQDVPDDIAVAEGSALARLIVGRGFSDEEEHGTRSVSNRSN